MKTVIGIVVVATGFALVSCGFQAKAQEGIPCWPAEVALKALSQLDQAPEAFGQVKAGDILIAANRETGGFTVLLRTDDGMLCALIGGTGYRVAAPGPKGDPA